MASLEEFLTPDRPREGFRIANAEQALWAARKLRQIQRRQAEHAAMADAEISRIQKWLADVNDGLGADAAYFEGLLAVWTRVETLAEKSKTVKLPGATLAWRASPKKLAYDADALMAWAKANRPEWIRTKEELALDAIRKAVIGGGEVVRDEKDALLVEIVEQPDRFSVKFSEEAE
ncbi:MAG: host-nuclease inhibitor Gam family protein [Thermaerobacter sp.]|nr:host-nuclease inhibitor Gam family protein [Thermaerobacter sp.]